VKFFKNGMVVAFELANFPGLLIGVHFFYFSLGQFFFCPLIFLLGHTLFTFFKFLIFLEKWNLCSMERMTYLAFLQSIMKNESYWYRKLTHEMRVKSSSNYEAKASLIALVATFLFAFLCGHFMA